jgi:hypothetical protein
VLCWSFESIRSYPNVLIKGRFCEKCLYYLLYVLGSSSKLVSCLCLWAIHSVVSHWQPFLFDCFINTAQLCLFYGLDRISFCFRLRLPHQENQLVEESITYTGQEYYTTLTFFSSEIILKSTKFRLSRLSPSHLNRYIHDNFPPDILIILKAWTITQ